MSGEEISKWQYVLWLFLLHSEESRVRYFPCAPIRGGWMMMWDHVVKFTIFLGRSVIQQLLGWRMCSSLDMQPPGEIIRGLMSSSASTCSLLIKTFVCLVAIHRDILLKSAKNGGLPEAKSSSLFFSWLCFRGWMIFLMGPWCHDHHNQVKLARRSLFPSLGTHILVVSNRGGYFFLEKHCLLLLKQKLDEAIVK